MTARHEAKKCQRIGQALVRKWQGPAIAFEPAGKGKRIGIGMSHGPFAAIAYLIDNAGKRLLAHLAPCSNALPADLE